MHLVWRFGKVCFPLLNGLRCGLLEVAISNACHDANMNAKSENLAQILGYQTGAVTHGYGGYVVGGDGDHAGNTPPEFSPSDL